MITKFQIQNYGCVRDLTLELTPLHALIGPNDSGKSTILSAIRMLTQLAAGPFSIVFDTRMQSGSALMATGAQGLFRVFQDGGNLMEEGADAAGRGASPKRRHLGQYSALIDDSTLGSPKMGSVLAQFNGARLVRFDPEALRSTSGLIPESQTASFLDDRGKGLPGIYQSIQGRGDDAFRELSERVRSLFPTIHRIRVSALTASQLEIGAELLNGTRISANEMSEGLLYFLAFASVPALSRTSLLLVEEPENGLHPARVADVMTILREISSKTQVIIATHSPLVINCLEANEVSVITRPSLEQGSKATLLRNTPNFEKRKEVYALGELWLSYADGNFESPLVNG